MADAGDGAVEHPAGVAEAEPVEQRDRPRAHRDDVAQDPADPVAAPWNGSTADGWLWLSTLKATASPSPRSTTPAFSPGPCSTRVASDGKPLQEQRRVLVAAVLRPEQREDRELEVVRLALEQLQDAVELPVGQTEGAVERLFGDRVRGSS